MTLQNYLKRIKKSLSVVVRGSPWSFRYISWLSVACPWDVVFFSKHYVPLSVVVRGDMFCLFSPYTVVRGCPWPVVSKNLMKSGLSVVVRGLSGKSVNLKLFRLKVFLENSSF